ncbi:MAG TPA: Uma2 family endonuclease, partial [Kofleriaceae bacterium]|nr:Uma2 family endonuclease [Kofleriaceae bacterium]
ADQRLLIHGVTWGQYTATRALFDDHPGLRMTYMEGTLEITSPSAEHERSKKIIARLIETYAVAKRIALNGYGSTTFKKQAAERGAEPDECYVIGAPLGEVPDIAIEVVITSGGVDKLGVYRGLSVPEVWFFHEGRFYVYSLQASGYEPRARSAYLPELDLEHLATFVDRPDQTDAVIAYRDSLG